MKSAAWWLAKERWPQIGTSTRIIRTDRREFVVPILENDTRSIMERWLPPQEYTPFRQERIQLDRVVNLEPVIAMGYGPKTDVLAVQIVD